MGRIVSPSGNPVSNAVVLHRSCDQKTLSDDKGIFSLNIPNSHKIILEIIHPDYMVKIVSLTLETLNKFVLIQLKPYFLQREDITVTAFRYPEASISFPGAETVLTRETIETNMHENVSEGLLELPGVSNIGAGGFSMVPNIRGLARRRILILLDNARVTSERRTGASASFVNPRDIDRIDVLRSPSSVFYGSDAIGGIIHILTRKPSLNNRIQGSIQTRYSTINQGKNIGFNLDGGTEHTGFYLSFQGVDADNYSSPEGEVLQSFFTQGSILGKISHETEKREIHLSFLGARGQNIGKANKDSISKPTWYPKEGHNFIQFQWKEKHLAKDGEIDFQVFLNPQYLETKKEKIIPFKKSESFSRTQSLDYGLFFSYCREIGKIRITSGADVFGRTGVQAKSITTTYAESGEILSFIEEWPYRNGMRSDLGFFLSFDYFGLKNIDLVSGGRLDIIRLKALPGGSVQFTKSEHKAVTGFIGSSFKITHNIVLFANIARAYRVPSISELFYSGITGRGSIIAQPELKPETSLNLDGGLRFFTKDFYLGAYIFVYEIDHLIERYMLQPKVYTYGNINKGRITGYELEIEYFPRPGWKIYGNYFAFFGKSIDSTDDMNDIPPARLFLGSEFWIGRLSLGIDTTIQQKKNNPGPAEISIPGYFVINIKANYMIGTSFRIFTQLSNCLQRSYIARPDPDAVYEPGRNLQLGLNYHF
jgi:outer membrane receptor protein involved in Fe transport